jgi:hypothetical protein
MGLNHVLIPGLKETPIIKHPWYHSIDDLITSTNPSARELDESQLDNRTEVIDEDDE